MAFDPNAGRVWQSFNQGGGDQGYGYQNTPNTGFNPNTSFSWQEFRNYQNQLQQANQQYQQQSGYQNQFSPWLNNQDYNLGNNRMFSMSGGTGSMFGGRYQDVNLFDRAAIEAYKGSEWWNQLPANLTGNEDLRFDQNKFDLSRGLFDSQNQQQLVNFVTSLPGQMVGGVLEGAADLYESISSRPVSEYREKQGGDYELPDYQLDASQRAADFIDSAINLGGTFTGGSGRIIGSVGKAGIKTAVAAGDIGKAASTYAKTARRSEMLDNMSKGMVTRALEGSKGQPLGTGLGILADVGDEASEEFIQSYAEDIRNKTLDDGSLERAMTGAAWGALGGGIMSAGGRGLSKVMDTVGQRTNRVQGESDISGTGMDPMTIKNPFDELSTIRPQAGMLNSVAADTISDSFTQHRDAPGSGVFKQTSTDASMQFDDIVLGTDNIENIFYANDRSAQKIAYAFGTDIETLNSVFAQSSNVAGDLNYLLAKKGDEDTKVAVGRNPDTKNGGYYMDLRSVVNGQAFITHPMVAGIVGSDWDGDQSSVYFDPDCMAPGDTSGDYRLDALGYASQMFLNGEGQSNVDWWYAGFDNTVRSNQARIKEILSDALAGDTREYKWGGVDVDAATYFSKRLSYIINMKGNERNTELSRYFTDLGQIEGRKVTNKILQQITGDTNAIIAQYLEFEANQVADNLRNMEGATEEQVDEVRKMLADWDSRGTLGDKTKVFQLTRSLGLLSYVMNENGNAPYRQYGQLYYMAKSVPAFTSMMTDIAHNVAKPESIVNQLIRSSFKMPQAGQSPAEAIESLCDTLLLSEVFTEANLIGRKIRSSAEIRNLQRIFVEKQRKYATIYNNCQKEITNLDSEDGFNSKYRNPLPEFNAETTGFGNEFMRQFNKVFENVLVTDIFAPEYFQGIDVNGLTWGGLIEYLSNSRLNGNAMLLLAEHGDYTAIKPLLLAAINERGSEKNGMESTIKALINDIDVYGIIGRYDNLGHLDPNDVPAMLRFMDAIQLIVDPELAIHVGILDPDQLLGTKVGRMLFSGDEGEMMNALTSISLYGQFSPYVKVLSDENSSDKARQNAEDHVQMLGYVSSLHAAIADSILNSDGAVFDWFTNLDLEWDYKLDEFEQVLGQIFPTDNYVIDSLRSGNDDFDLSSVSARMKKARSAINQAKRFVQDSVRNEVSSWKAAVSTQQNVDGYVAAYVMQRCRDAFTMPNRDMLGMKIYASMTLDNSFVEKAVNADVEVAMFMANQLGVNGNMVNHIDMITGNQFGHISKADWASNRYHILACISDPTYRQEVWDPDTGKITTMSQYALFKSIDQDFMPNSPITANHIFDLLDAYPQIAGYICEGGTNVSPAAEGGLGVQGSRQTSIGEDYERWLHDNGGSQDVREDVLRDSQMTRALNFAEAWLYNQSAAHKIVTLMLDPDNIEGRIDPEKLAKDARNKMQALARYVYNRATLGTTADAQARNKFRTNRITSLCTDLWNAVAYANEQMENQFQFGAMDSIEGKLLYSKLANMRMTGYIQDKYGLFADIGDIDVTGSIEGVVTSMQERMTDSYKRTMRVAEMLVMVMGNAQDTGFDGVIGSMVDRNSLVSQVQQQLLAKEPEGDRNTKATRRKVAREAEEIVSDAIANSMTPGTEAIEFAGLLSEKDFASEDTLRAKLREMYKSDPQLLDGIEGDVKNAFKGPKAQSDLIRIANMNVIREELREISKLNGMPVNENALQLEFETMDQLDDLVKNFEAQMGDKGIFMYDRQVVEDWFRDHSYSPETLPPMDFFSEAKQSSITQQSVMDQAAGNPVKVGVNGGMGKKVYPIGHLPKQLDADAASGNAVPVPDVRLGYLGEYRGWNAVDGDGNVLPVNSPAFREYLFSQDAADAGEIILYDPDDNPHGLPSYNMPSTEYNPYADYHRLSGIIGAMIDFSQEAMVLKSKKAFRAVTELVPSYQRAMSGRYASRLVKQDFDSMYEAMKGTMDSFRSEYRKKLEAEFFDGGTMDKLGFGSDQARILSQFLSPGIIVTMLNGDKQVIDASCFYGPNARENFDIRMTQLIQPDENGIAAVPLSIDILTTTLHEASARIAKAVSAARQRNGGDITVEEAEQAAVSVIQDWSDYSQNLVDDVQGVLSSITPLGYTRRSRITALDSPTPVQWFYNQVTDGATNAMIDTISEEPVLVYDPEESKWNQPLHVASELGLRSRDGNLVPVLKSFIAKSESRRGTQAARNLHNALSPVRGDRGNNMKRGVGIAYVDGDPDELARQISRGLVWARKTGSLLYIPSEFVDSYRYLGNRAITGNKFTYQGIEFTGLLPSMSERWHFSRESMPNSETIPGDKSQIRMAVVTPSSMYNMGDAEMVYMPNMDDVTTRRDKRPSQSVNNYFPMKDNSPKSLLNRQTASEILDLVAKQNPTTGRWEPLEGDWSDIDLGDGSIVSFDLATEAVRNAGHSVESNRKVKELVVKYLVDMRNGVGTNKDAKPSNPVRSEVAALITNGTTISPVFYPKDLPSYVYYSNVEIKNGKVEISFSGETKLHEPDTSSSQKWMLQGETFKGMVSRYRGSFIPKIFGGTKNAMEANFLVSADTEGSRVANRELPLLKNALYYLSRLRDASLFFDGDDYSQYIKDNWSAADKRALADPTDNAFWMRIVNGELRLTANPDTNRHIQDAFLQCLRYGISPMYLFSTYRIEVNNETGEMTHVPLGREIDGNDGYKDVNFQMIFQNFNADQMLKIYHAMDSELCAEGIDDKRSRGEYVIDRNGMSLVQMDGGRGWMTMPVRYGYHQVLGDTTQETMPSGESAVSMQHAGRRAMDKGYIDEELARAIDYEDYLFGNNDHAMQVVLDRLDEVRNRKVHMTEQAAPGDMSIATLYPYGTTREIMRVARIARMLDDMFTHRRPVTSAEDPNGENDPMQNRDIRQAVQYFNSIVRKYGGNSTTFSWLDFASMFAEGSSYAEGSGDWTITAQQLKSAIMEMADNLDDAKNPLLIKVPYTDSSKANGRFAIPLIPREMANWIWNNFRNVREAYGTFDGFYEAMRAEQDKAEMAIGSIDQSVGNNKSRYKTLSEMCDAVRLQWNDVSTISPCYEDYSFQQIDRDINSLAKAMSTAESWSQEQWDLYRKCCEMSEEKLKLVREYLVREGYQTMNVKGATGGIVAWSKQSDAKFIAKTLNNAAELSKVMAILNPFISVANIADRMIHQGIMNAAMQAVHKLKIGPYANENWLDQTIVDKAVNDPVAIELYSSYRAAEFNSEEMLFIANAIENKNLQSIREWTKTRRKQMTLFQKATEWVYQIGSGGNFRIKGQMRNFINRFVMFAEENGQDFWFEPTDLEVVDNNGNSRQLMRIEALLQSPGGFSEFFLDVIGAHGATPSYTIAMQAMNSAKTGDMAQKNAVGLVISDLCRKIPFGKFLMTTCVSRFPMYGINVTGRMLNWVLPVSSINYVFTEYLSKTDYGKRLGVEETQIHRSLREAMMIDILKLGVGGTALVLFSLSGAVQPPDDEKKWGNPDEWLLFGTRAGENWWVQDILGMAWPMACFWASAERGKPRFDIITNGISQACYSNPILRCADVADWLINPTESLISDYNEDVVQFQKAKGGAPSMAEYLLANYGFSLGMNWASQFVTPSIVREWYQAATPFEKSYKKVYETSPTGKLTEEGERGKLVYTTYDDAIKRKLARRNPVLAALFEFTNGTATSYWGPNMPDNVYYDDYQLAATDMLSVQGLDDNARMAKVVDIISVLQSYDDMDELAETGFHLDYETLQAVAAQVWDNYHAADEWYYGLQADGQLNYYVLGNGDYASGQAMAGQLKLEWQQQKQYWYDFYYQKLKNSPIAGQLQTYNRYNTTYAQDVYGDVYATGILRSPYNMLPFTNAPGTIEAAENTAGYENDFATVSAVTGLPMNQRALIPNIDGNIELPDFEYWSGDGEGNTYSKQYQTIYGDKGDISVSKNSYGTSSSYSNSRNYGSGGGYSRGGYGGGGYSRSYSSRGYTPNITSPSANAPTNLSLPRASLSKSNASRIMGTDRLVQPNENYLRPDFETKGSREAYKRSDI